MLRVTSAVFSGGSVATSSLSVKINVTSVIYICIFSILRDHFGLIKLSVSYYYQTFHRGWLLAILNI